MSERLLIKFVMSGFLLLSGCTCDLSQISVAATPYLNGGSVATNESLSSSSTVLLMNFKPGDSNITFCTGSVIADDLVLTAAHCLTDGGSSSKIKDPRVIFIIFKKRFSLDDDQDINSLQEQVHTDRFVARSPDIQIPQGYALRPTSLASMKHENKDIALIHLHDTLPEGYRPIKLLKSSAPLIVGAKIIQAGFGPPIPIKSKLELILRERSTVITKSSVPNQDIETQNTIGPKVSGPSHGDSGGPGFITSGTETFLFGVYSYGIAAQGEKQSGYESVIKWNEWIKAAADHFGTKLE